MGIIDVWTDCMSFEVCVGLLRALMVYLCSRLLLNELLIVEVWIFMFVYTWLVRVYSTGSRNRPYYVDRSIEDIWSKCMPFGGCVGLLKTLMVFLCSGILLNELRFVEVCTFMFVCPWLVRVHSSFPRNRPSDVDMSIEDILRDCNPARICAIFGVGDLLPIRLRVPLELNWRSKILTLSSPFD